MNNVKMPDLAVPEYYDAANFILSDFNPSYYHVKNTTLQRYFFRYLLNKAMSVFEFEIPDNWDLDYLLYCLYAGGYVGVFDTAEYGVISQFGGISGYDLYYRPKKFTCANPYLKKQYYDLEIGTECIIVKMTNDYRGIYDLINYYADLLALCAETAGINLYTARVGYVAVTSSKTGAETLKKAFDQAAGGDPFVVLDKQMMREDGSTPWEWFSQNLKQNYLITDIVSDMRKIEQQFETVIGINNANTDKRERLITDEVNANDEAVKANSDVWLQNLKDGFSKVKDLFSVTVSVKRRYKDAEAATSVNSGTVSRRQDDI